MKVTASGGGPGVGPEDSVLQAVDVVEFGQRLRDVGRGAAGLGGAVDVASNGARRLNGTGPSRRVRSGKSPGRHERATIRPQVQPTRWRTQTFGSTYTAWSWARETCTGVSAPGTVTSPSRSNGRPVHFRHWASVPGTTIEAGHTFTTRPPARTCTRSHGSSGSPSSRVLATYWAIG